MTAPTVRRQPWVHDRRVAVHAPVTCVSDPAGDIGGDGTGLFVDDRRVISSWELRVAGEPVTVVASRARGGTLGVVAAARAVDPAKGDLLVEIHRDRTLSGDGFAESLTVHNRSDEVVRVPLDLAVAGDGADLGSVKAGDDAASRAPVLPVETAPDGLSWFDARHRTTVTASRPILAGTPAPGSSSVLVLAPGAVETVRMTVTVERLAPTPFDAGHGDVDWSAVRVEARDPRLGETVAAALADLRGLLLADPDEPGDSFAAAGSPWYLTLFGRDSLWTARMLLPFGTGLAAGTLRALARRQGRCHDPDAAEEPGRIPHEVRRTQLVDPTAGLVLPPVYYGSVDATPLWVVLLHEAWTWGMPETEVRGLAGPLLAALDWVHRAEETGGGLLTYADPTGHGLANQGWKDSSDALRRVDGTVATGPIALVEAQAHAVDAARRGAELCERVLGRDGSAHRALASRLSGVVRERFWVSAPEGRRLAMALDGEGRPVDGVGSNQGHALGTGSLTPDEVGRVAAALTGPDLLTRYGVRTLGASNPAYRPLGYHTGSVWTHDTAVCALGLAAEGRREEATRLVGALLDLSPHVDLRWPELLGGEDLLGGPVPYPATCRPQAWSAASAAAVVTVLLGARADAPAGRLELAPVRPSLVGAMRVTGLRVGGERVDVALDAAGEVVEIRAPDGLTVEVLSS